MATQYKASGIAKMSIDVTIIISGRAQPITLATNCPSHFVNRYSNRAVSDSITVPSRFIPNLT